MSTDETSVSRKGQHAFRIQGQQWKHKSYITRQLAQRGQLLEKHEVHKWDSSDHRLYNSEYSSVYRVDNSKYWGDSSEYIETVVSTEEAAVST
jgi:predicted secreted hydrolase